MYLEQKNLFVCGASTKINKTTIELDDKKNKNYF